MPAVPHKLIVVIAATQHAQAIQQREVQTDTQSCAASKLQKGGIKHGKDAAGLPSL